MQIAQQSICCEYGLLFTVLNATMTTCLWHKHLWSWKALKALFFPSSRRRSVCALILFSSLSNRTEVWMMLFWPRCMAPTPTWRNPSHQTGLCGLYTCFQHRAASADGTETALDVNPHLILSFLTQRRQRIWVNGYLSSPTSLSTGLVMYTLYPNDHRSTNP